jgi:hypothetical protein
MMPARAALLALTLAAPLAAAAADKPKAMEATPPPAANLAPAERPTLGRCEVSKQLCIDFEGEFAEGVAAATCARARGTFAAGACPDEGRLGTCFFRQPGSAERTLYRHYRPGDAKALKSECKKRPGSAWLVN